MARSTGFGLSFLDLICSAMGGVIILAIIFSIIKNPVAVPKQGEFVLVEVQYAVGPNIGVVVSDPQGRSLAVTCNSREHAFAHNYTSDTRLNAWLGRDGDKQARLYVVVRNPAPGSWTFSPYFVDWAPEVISKATIIDVKGWTRAGPLAKWDKLPEPLGRPGESSRTSYVVEIERCGR